MKGQKITYWVTTVIVFLMEAVMPALTFNSDLAKQGISHLGYPDYFRVYLTVCKIIGCIILIVPQVPKRIKEWAYVGLGIIFVSASVSYLAVDGLGGYALMPLVFLVILALSYRSYHKMNDSK